MTDKPKPRLSVVITNYNYAAYVRAAIDSVLSQPEDVELVVVDDCSTDNSRDIISSYGDRLIPVFQAQNRGHGGGFNAGFAQTTGDLVMFLDADDFLLPGAVKTILSNYDPDVGMYIYRMRYADSEGHLGGVFPPLEVGLAQGDVSRQLRETGRYGSTITSGLVFRRKALENVMPMDAEEYRQGGDGYLSATVPLYVPVLGFDQTISGYRMHQAQHSQFAKAYAKRARWSISHQLACYGSIREHAGRLGLPVSADLDTNDPGLLKQRLVSLMFEPELHPVQGDTRKDLLRMLKQSTASMYGGSAFARNLWWTLIGVLPHDAARTVLSWNIDVDARPRWLNTLGRTLRQRFGIVSH